ncbi:MAG: nuclear transport factor 2 family protein [Alphaproteobacteria bacterium]|nr:nuclear transport factor 2 family protein [Alphaproteobacteria bacterium]
MHDHEALITRFYTAFQNRDGDAMAACYHPDATFSDPVFPALSGREPGAMWRMLTSRAEDLVVRFGEVKADDTTGSAHWDADYTFSATGRFVRNSIDAKFTFRDGLIATHVDDFDFWRWSRQALGVPGVLLGWSGFLKGKVRGQAAEQLGKFVAKHG